MAKRPKNPDEPSRQEKVAASAEEAAKKARQNRIEKAVVVVSVVVGLVALGVIIKKHHGGAPDGKDDKTYKALSAIGNTAFISGCAAVAPTNDPVPDKDVVVPDGEKVKYPVPPPSSGPHLAKPVDVNSDGFYAPGSSPPVPGLVANLNVGWTVLWYEPNILGPDQVALIKKAANVLHNDPRYSTFVAAAWDDADGRFPEGTPIALTRWTKETGNTAGHRSYCHETSGEAFREFMAFFGAPKIPSIDGDS